MGDSEQDPGDRIDGDNQKNDKMFTLKKWNAVAMWSWDVECDTCAICRVQVMAEDFRNKSKVGKAKKKEQTLLFTQKREV
ncbi:RING-box protein 2 [Trachymyrmex zeteki]|uniref:RING-box protein 2 n=1 Tax=Mycetomoellerius zeteki TaxID=64791 RepID=A0A151WV01_9HYME|nr:RING-box protein 2 [Trachymyrmex zeteki]